MKNTYFGKYNPMGIFPVGQILRNFNQRIKKFIHDSRL